MVKSVKRQPLPAPVVFTPVQPKVVIASKLHDEEQLNDPKLQQPLVEEFASDIKENWRIDSVAEEISQMHTNQQPELAAEAKESVEIFDKEEPTEKETKISDQIQLEAMSAPVKKPTSWAGLFRGQTAGTSGLSKGPNALPSSSVIGFSIPAEAITRAPSSNEQAIVKLLTAKITKAVDPHRLSPRGLLNLGNMCFANIVLQGLVYTYPFWSLLRELKKLNPTPSSLVKGTPLLNATYVSSCYSFFILIHVDCTSWMNSR